MKNSHSESWLSDVSFRLTQINCRYDQYRRCSRNIGPPNVNIPKHGNGSSQEILVLQTSTSPQEAW